MIKKVKILEPDPLYRPDISTDDCTERAIEIEHKVMDDHETVFNLADEDQLDEWMTVCCVRLIGREI